MRVTTQPQLARLVILCLFVLGLAALGLAVCLALWSKVEVSVILALIAIANAVTLGMCALLASTKDTHEGQSNTGTGIQAENVTVNESERGVTG